MFLKVISFNLGTIRGRGRRHLVLIRYKEVASAPNPELSGRFIYAFNKEEWVSLCAQREGHLMCLTPHVPKAKSKTKRERTPFTRLLLKCILSIIQGSKTFVRHPLGASLHCTKPVQALLILF